MKYLSLISRILLVLMFLLSGISKISDFGWTVAMASSVGIPMANIAIVLAIIIEIGGAVFVILGGKYATSGALLLALFTLVASYYFHAFWMLPKDAQMIQMIMFMKNMSVTGGLLFVAAHYMDKCMVMNCICTAKKK